MSSGDPNPLVTLPNEEKVQSLQKRHYIRLSTRLALSFALVAIILVGIMTFTYYQNTRSQLREDIRTRLRDAVAIGAMQINGDAHALLVNPAQEGTDIYIGIKKILQGIRDAGTEIRFVYTMRQDDQGNIVFIVDAEESEEDISHLGDIYDDASILLKSSFSSLDQPIVEEDFYTDKWGTWLTGYSPFYSSDGTREGILGMDISATNVLAHERQALWRALSLFLVSIPLIFGIGWFLGNRLSEPIARLSEAAETIANGDLSVRITTASRSREVHALQNSFNRMSERVQELVTGLEERVGKRTQELEVANESAKKRADQLETIARISQTITSIRKPEALLTRITELISQRMGYYHVGIFLLDGNQEFAVLEAANSAGGQQMLKRKHRLKVGQQGIVGHVALRGNPRIALDVGEDAVFFDNRDLPATRSEMALPLKHAEKTIGVLDLQSDEPNAFSSEDIEVLTILAEQLAISIQNARSFELARLAIQRAETEIKKQSAENWKQLSLKQRILGYRYNGIQPEPQFESVHLETKNSLEIPVQLRNLPIGKIRLSPFDPKRSFTDDEIAMVRAAAERAALALENARLLEDAQRRAAKESLIGEISTKIVEATDTNQIMAATVSELQRILGASEVSFRLSIDEPSA